MNPKIREMYKKLLFIGKYQYPFNNFPKIKERFRAEIMKNKDVKDEIELKKLLAFGRYQLRELLAAGKLHKYRTLNKRYTVADDDIVEKEKNV
jgi:hypothetical protein